MLAEVTAKNVGSVFCDSVYSDFTTRACTGLMPRSLWCWLPIVFCLSSSLLLWTVDGVRRKKALAVFFLQTFFVIAPLDQSLLLVSQLLRERSYIADYVRSWSSDAMVLRDVASALIQQYTHRPLVVFYFSLMSELLSWCCNNHWFGNNRPEYLRMIKMCLHFYVFAF